jgi:hypothetical protein
LSPKHRAVASVEDELPVSQERSVAEPSAVAVVKALNRAAWALDEMPYSPAVVLLRPRVDALRVVLMGIVLETPPALDTEQRARVVARALRAARDVEELRARPPSADLRSDSQPRLRR